MKQGMQSTLAHAHGWVCDKGSAEIWLYKCSYMEE